MDTQKFSPDDRFFQSNTVKTLKQLTLRSQINQSVHALVQELSQNQCQQNTTQSDSDFQRTNAGHGSSRSMTLSFSIIHYSRIFNSIPLSEFVLRLCSARNSFSLLILTLAGGLLQTKGSGLHRERCGFVLTVLGWLLTEVCRHYLRYHYGWGGADSHPVSTVDSRGKPRFSIIRQRNSFIFKFTSVTYSVFIAQFIQSISSFRFTTLLIVTSDIHQTSRHILIIMFIHQLFLSVLRIFRGNSPVGFLCLKIYKYPSIRSFNIRQQSFLQFHSSSSHHAFSHRFDARQITYYFHPIEHRSQTFQSFTRRNQ